MQRKLSWQSQPHCPVSISAQFSVLFMQNFRSHQIQGCRNPVMPKSGCFARHAFSATAHQWKTVQVQALSLFLLQNCTVTNLKVFGPWKMMSIKKSGHKQGETVYKIWGENSNLGKKGALYLRFAGQYKSSVQFCLKWGTLYFVFMTLTTLKHRAHLTCAPL